MPHATRPGDVLADRYRLVDLLSESGDGRFWRAHDRVLERHVAVHVIRADDARAPGLMAAARQSATVHDRRILRVLDADVTDEVCYVVNEWGWGTSLDIVVTATGPLGPRRAAWLVSEVAESIAAAHASGVPHGRLNPENVLIDRAGGSPAHRLLRRCRPARRAHRGARPRRDRPGRPALLRAHRALGRPVRLDRRARAARARRAAAPASGARRRPAPARRSLRGAPPPRPPRPWPGRLPAYRARHPRLPGRLRRRRHRHAGRPRGEHPAGAAGRRARRAAAGARDASARCREAR